MILWRTGDRARRAASAGSPPAPASSSAPGRSWPDGSPATRSPRTTRSSSFQGLIGPGRDPVPRLTAPSSGPSATSCFFRRYPRRPPLLLLTRTGHSSRWPCSASSFASGRRWSARCGCCRPPRHAVQHPARRGRVGRGLSQRAPRARLRLPVVLLLAGYLAAFRARPAPRARWLAVLLAVSAGQAVSAASKTRAGVADRRAACEFLATLPAKPVYSDFQMATWAASRPCRTRGRRCGRPGRAPARYRGDSDGYLITGGGREPIYGCVDCIPRADEVGSPSTGGFVRELPGPATPTP